MERLTLEELARLVDEAPTERERKVLEQSPDLRDELDALRQQTEALGDLPSVMPPLGDWAGLEQRLLEEGLVRPTRGGGQPPRWWVQMAAGLMLFVGGTALGQALGPENGPDGQSTSGAFASVEEAAQAVEFAERQYLQAVDGYQRTVRSQDGSPPARDPASRFAALEALLAASQAAVKESPADPFFNGILINTLRERQQTLRQVSGDNWY